MASVKFGIGVRQVSRWREQIRESEECLCDECVAARPERAKRRDLLVARAKKRIDEHLSDKQGGRNADF